MTQLVHHCWPRLKALKLAFTMLVQSGMGGLLLCHSPFLSFVKGKLYGPRCWT
jgi:hypothetical protein